MSGYLKRIPGVPVGRIPDPTMSVHLCRRCGIDLSGARAETVHCSDCVATLKAEASAELYGIDLAELDDDEWFVRRKNKTKDGRRVARIVKVAA